MIIAFIGRDGVGKSSVARGVVTQLKSRGYSVEFCDSFEKYFLLRKLLKIFVFARSTAAADFRGENDVKKKNIIFTFWPYLIWFDQLLFYIYLRAFKSTKIIIGDRYAFSYLVTWKYYGHSNKLIEWLYLHFPQPDMVFNIWLPYGLARKRKLIQEKGVIGVYHKEFFDFHMEEYKKLRKSFNIEKIDNSGSLSDTIKTVVGKIESEIKHE